MRYTTAFKNSGVSRRQPLPRSHFHRVAETLRQPLQESIQTILKHAWHQSKSRGLRRKPQDHRPRTFAKMFLHWSKHFLLSICGKKRRICLRCLHAPRQRGRRYRSRSFHAKHKSRWNLQSVPRKVLIRNRGVIRPVDLTVRNRGCCEYSRNPSRDNSPCDRAANKQFRAIKETPTNWFRNER